MRKILRNKKIKFAFWIILILVSVTAFKMADDRFEVSKNIEIFTAVYKEVNLNYVDETKSGELMRKSIDAMLGSLDPYTVFYSEAQAEEAFTQRTGEYGGMGVSVTPIGEYLVITDVFEGFAGEKAGIKIGDKILAINGKNLKGKTLDELSPMAKGAAGTELILTISRPGSDSTLNKVIKREEIKLKNVPYYGKVNETVGYIYLSNFMQDAAKEVQTALTELKKEGCTGIILDLRGNPGGYLLESVKIVNLFVPQGELVVYTKGRTEKDIQEYKTPNRPIDLNIPLVVLINGRSASASEIVSGTLQDLDRAVVMGSNSFGKGLVQTTRQLPYRSQMKITTAKYYTPSGRCIQALDYSNRNLDGSVGKVADSLRQAFTTKKGRTVYDGGGVKPDKDIDVMTNDQIIQSLQQQYLIFDFAVNFVNTHPKKQITERFNITDDDFNNFLIYTEKHIERVNTVNDIQFDNLKKNLQKTTDNQSVQSALNNLEKAMLSNKLLQIKEDKTKLMDVLSLEIVRVYGLSSMHSKAQFLKDVTTIKAIETLQNQEIYIQYLK